MSGNTNHEAPATDPWREAIQRQRLADEAAALEALIPVARLDSSIKQRTRDQAKALIETLRCQSPHQGAIAALLHEFDLSTNEGVALMCLAESLLRIPDAHTANRLISDKLLEGDWAAHAGHSRSIFVNASTWALLITGKLYGNTQAERENLATGLKQLILRLGQSASLRAARFAVGLIGEHFIIGQEIKSALARAHALEKKGYRISYDILGERARTREDADRHCQRYLEAIVAIGKSSPLLDLVARPGISIKLSALHPRYEFAQRERVMAELTPRLQQLALAARDGNIGLTVDAEETRHLELSLDILEVVFRSPQLAEWQGFGMAIQAYQKCAPSLITWCRQLAERVGRPMAVRLVKGAYWDTEIKAAQVLGLANFPVFTRKAATDVSYQACARQLLDARPWLFPQFATHNAYSVATILALDPSVKGFEFQRLQGMGEELYDALKRHHPVPCRIYAPVGTHTELLPYLVRRLLENASNSSFVHRLENRALPIDRLLSDPVDLLSTFEPRQNPAIALPGDLYGEDRLNSSGIDLNDPRAVGLFNRKLISAWQGHRHPQSGLAQQNPVYNPANLRELVGWRPGFAGTAEITQALERAHSAFADWSQTSPTERFELLNRFANGFERHREELVALCVKEAGKTLPDSIAEVREAVDFCRYYAAQARQVLSQENYRPRGVALCISPWNFPLAIFVGQLIAAIAAGNTVVAKPAEQTPMIALLSHQIMQSEGLPEYVVNILVSPGKPVGEQLLQDPRVRAVMFTGSTETAQWINRRLAQRDDAPVTFIAETGGQNAMVVDSTALMEQVLDDVLRSAFQSAGQRCSSLRVLFLQEDIAERTTAMLRGAMDELCIGDPALLSTDIGPVIDREAFDRLHQHAARMDKEATLLHCCRLSAELPQGYFFAPRIYGIDHISTLDREVFGPVLHIIRYPRDRLDATIDEINSTGYGLTLGIHSRIASAAYSIAQRAAVGNVYVNRDMIGAVVGVQPFGGRGLSGTGPKAGGPHYLQRLVELAAETSPGIYSLSAGARREDPAPSAVRAKPIEAPEQTLLQHWDAPLGERISVLGSLLAILEKSASTERQLIDSIRAMLLAAPMVLASPQTLPGPTGESNQLFALSRGLILSLYLDHEETQDWLSGTMAALAAGCAVLALQHPQCSAMAERYRQLGYRSGLSEEVFQIAEFTSLEALATTIDNYSPAGFYISSASSWKRALTRLLAQRKGPIVPLICDPPGRLLLQRFTVEKTITINTCASGGDTQLLSLAEL